MRYLLLLLLLPAMCVAQKKTYHLSDTNMRFDSATGGVVYTEVIQVPGASAEQLYSRAKSFLTSAFNTDGMITQTDDKAAGVVSSRGRLSKNLTTGLMMLTGQLQAQYEMTAEIRVKEGRYRYEISNIAVVINGYRRAVDETYQKDPSQAKKVSEREMSQKEYDAAMSPDKNPAQALASSLKRAMQNGSNKNDF